MNIKTSPKEAAPFNNLPDSVKDLYSLCQKRVRDTDENEPATFDKNYKSQPYDRFFCGGDGYEATIIFPHAGGAFLFGYDSDNILANFHIEPWQKQPVFDGMPEEYSKCLEGGVLGWDWANTDIVFASCAAWLNDGVWECNNSIYEDLEGSYDAAGGFESLFRTLLEADI